MNVAKDKMAFCSVIGPIVPGFPIPEWEEVKKDGEDLVRLFSFKDDCIMSSLIDKKVFEKLMGGVEKCR